MKFVMKIKIYSEIIDEIDKEKLLKCAKCDMVTFFLIATNQKKYENFPFSFSNPRSLQPEFFQPITAGIFVILENNGCYKLNFKDHSVYMHGMKLT